MAKQQYTIGRVFVGDRPIEELTEEERVAFQRRTVKRMGDVFNNYFSRHPDVYVRVCEKYAIQNDTQEGTPVNTASTHSAAVRETLMWELLDEKPEEDG